MLRSILRLSLICWAGAAAAAAANVVACRNGACQAVEHLEKADFAWVWSPTTPPIRLTGEALSGGVPDLSRTEHALRVRVHGLKEEEEVVLIAAPQRMWGEVPEPLLPRYIVISKGVVTLPYTPGEKWRARAVGPEAGTWWLDLDEQLGRKGIRVSPAAPREIRVESDDGRALPGAQVSIVASVSGQPPSVVSQLEADENGSVTFANVPDDDPVHLVVNAAGHAPEAVTARIGQLPSKIRLAPGYEILGKFTDQEDRPIPGATVRAEGWLSTEAVVTRKAESDKEGRWKLELLPARTKVVILARAEGFVAIRREVKVIDENVDLGPTRMTPGINVPVRVVDDLDGRPIKGARIRTDFAQDTTTDAEGVAILRNVSPDSELHVRATASGYLPATTAIIASADEEGLVALTRPFTVTGRFVTDTGAIIGDATVRIGSGDSFREQELPDGEFELHLEPDVVLDLEFRSRTTEVARREVRGGRGEHLDLGEVTPPNGNSVVGTVVTEDGAPVRDATVWTLRPSASGALTAWITGDELRAHTDELGAFELAGIPPQPVLIRVDATGYARAFRTAAADPLTRTADLGDVILERGTTLKVIAGDGDTTGYVRIILDPLTAEIDALTSPVVDGTAIIPNVPPGERLVRVLRRDVVMCEKQVFVPSRREPFTVECRSTNLTISGTVMIGDRIADGGILVWSSPFAQDIPGVIVGSRSHLGAIHEQVYGAGAAVSVPVGQDGQFTTSDLRAGDWNVRWVSPESGSTKAISIRIAEKAVQHVLLQYADSVLRGAVVTATSQPVPGARVRDASGRWFAVTGKDGSFAMHGLTPGRHQVRADAQGLQSHAAEVTIEPGKNPAPVRLTLQERKSGTIEVLVLDTRRQPVPNAFVFLESGRQSLVLTTDAAGRARGTFADGEPAAMRFAVVHAAAWALGPSLLPHSWDRGLTITLTEPGTLTIVSDRPESTVAIRGPNGWDVSLLLMRLGSQVQVRPESPFLLTGLPPGSYEVIAGASRASATIVAGKATTVTLK